MSTILSYGGGVNSTALAVLRENEIDEMVFSWHGGDYPETYDYVRYMERQGFPITILTPEVEGYSTLPDWLEGKGLFPSRVMRSCTDKWKIRPLTKYVQGLGTAQDLYIGFSKGEEKRIRGEFRFRKGITASHPLIQEGVDREGCIQIIKDAGLKVPNRSACWFCFNARCEELQKLKRDYPLLWERRKRIRRKSWEMWGQRHFRTLPQFA